MADEQQQEQQAPPVAEEDFDWEKFFLDEAEEAGGSPPPPVASQAPPQDLSDEEDEEEAPSTEVAALKKQVEALTKQVSEASRMATETTQSAHVQSAIEAWKAQASPGELRHAAVLAGARNLDELKLRAEIVKETAANFDAELGQARTQVERELQQEYGIPLPPNFQPIPDKDKMEEALKEGDLDTAARLAVKGLF